jgi:ABC-2 type transport system ATP-binding protein
MIHFDKVSKVFKTDLLTQPFVALDQVEFQIPEGSMVGFLGANGAGKTTSMKIIMDFIRPTSGEVSFSEKLGTSKMEIFKNIGFLPERPYFYPHLTGEDFLLFMGQLSEIPKSQIKAEIQRLAARFRIDHALKRELKTYSKGMLQRIGFMATIMHRPKIIFLDEPLSGLDPVGRKELKDVIIEVHRAGTTVFFSSHIVPDIEEICDRVIFLKTGKLVYDGSVSALMNQGATQDAVITVRSEGTLPQLGKIKSQLQLPEALMKLTLDSSDVPSVLSELLQSNVTVLSLDRVKPSLEEIFYNTRNSK